MPLSGLFIGLLLGVVLQRGQFCLSRQLHNIVFQRNLTALSPLLLLIAIQAIGFFLLEQQGLIRLPSSPMPITATLFGAFLFGVGMSVANRCVTGHLYRSGEGSILGWITLLIFALTTTATQTGMLKFWVANMLQSQSQLVTVPQSLAISPLYFILPLSALAIIAVIKSKRTASFFPSGFSAPWSPHFTALLIGLISIAAWWSSAQTGREFGLSFSIPLGNSVQYVVLGQQRYLNWGTYLIFGIVIGAFLSAWQGKKLLWKSLSAAEFGKSTAGGILMGIGAALTGGCTMANAVVGTAYFSWQAWIAALMMMLGVYCYHTVKQNIIHSTN
ncbi:YeeE/YedE family protein [Testudinibacter sp. P80/BLE/0925]|uniref:YeeE/YedE family protein n=1 Tax=Testudinibacter sp. TW-1 TaxID=3417757 RepID=UPI003D367C5E